MPVDEILRAIRQHIEQAEARYGNFASTHEATGVMWEEFYELTGAVHTNNLEQIYDEAIDLAAVCIRLAQACADKKFRERSVK